MQNSKNSNNPEQYIGYLIADVARLMRMSFGKRAKQIGLSRAEWLVLAWLRRNEGISQARLSEVMEISPMTLGRLIDKLEATGLVVRRHAPNDRRTYRLHLAPHAPPKLDRLWEMSAETRSEALAGVSSSDVLRLVKILTTMRRNMAKLEKPEAVGSAEEQPKQSA